MTDLSENALGACHPNRSLLPVIDTPDAFNMCNFCSNQFDVLLFRRSHGCATSGL